MTVSNFSLATTRSVKTKSGGYKDQTDWHNVMVWQSENLASYLTKGKHAMLLICSPCTRLAPPRIAEATWTASVYRFVSIHI